MKPINQYLINSIENRPTVVTKRMISVVVPCYLDAGNILELVRRLKFVLNKCAPNHEILYINDASPDNAAEILDNLAGRHPEITVIHHSRNFSLMGVYNTGMRQAMGDAVILMDGDLQDPPEVIEEFIRQWEDGYLVVYGESAQRREKWLRKLGMKLFYRLWNRVSQFSIPKDAGDFSLIDRKIVDILNSLPETDRMFRGLRAWVGFPQISVPFIRDARFSGPSTQSYTSYFSFAGFAISSFSIFPLRLITLIAAIAVVMCLGFFIFLLCLYAFGVRGPEGFMLTISVVLLLGTAILCCLSIISEYLIRIYLESKKRPASIVGKILNNHRDEGRTQ